jgi:hypothetical protein
VAVADVNGDGRPDIVVATYSQVSVLLGNGNGSFKAAKNFAAGTRQHSIAVADLNGDGKLDLITANAYSTNNVSVLLGKGNGSFQAAQNYTLGIYPSAVAVADLNGDGVLDLAVADSNDASVAVLVGQRNAATHFLVSAPGSVTAGASFTITVTALTAGGQTDCNYTGTVKFTSGDPSAVLPAAYTFTLADGGTHTFTVTLNTTGTQTLTATDKNDKLIKGKVSVTVNSASPPAPAPGNRSGRAATSGTAAPDFPSQAESARAQALAALLAEGGFPGTGTGQHPVAGSAEVVGSRALPAALTISGTFSVRGASSVTAIPTAASRPHPDAELDRARLGLGDLEAFFAAGGEVRVFPT